MNLNDFDYELPQELIAQTPVEPRDHSRLLVYNKASDKVETKHFYDIVDYLNKGDVVVINNTKVMQARLHSSDGKFEILLCKCIDEEKHTWEILLKNAKKLQVGGVVTFGDGKNVVVGTLDSKDVEAGTAVMSFNRDPEPFGEMPLPQYIKDSEHAKAETNRYNTVYASDDKKGSAAAPTAGLHWTPELMEKVRKKGVVFCEILLHVGIGTFRPVKVENIKDHKMHAEYYEVSQAAADMINNARKNGNRIICVGTTSVRTLESVYAKFGDIRADAADTSIYIYPGFKYNVTDALITNFHLPKSTLVMLVSAYIGREKTLELYNFAVREKFRFFSFGDACLFMLK